jgi:NADPH-dependent 2,4-dienoyl-CoA reductase/sulfur reductase-like enzyme
MLETRSQQEASKLTKGQQSIGNLFGRSDMAASHHVVIVGGGFGGLHAARALRRAPVEVTLIDRRNFHLFQPLLYQVATGGLSPANIAAPLRAVLAKQQNAQVLLAEVRDVDLSQRCVRFSDGQLSYDTLIVGAGSGHHYFGNDHWEALAPGLKTIEDATEIRRRTRLRSPRKPGSVRSRNPTKPKSVEDLRLLAVFRTDLRRAEARAGRSASV